MPDYSNKQVGVIGEYEPELCAVSGRPIRGKHAITHYKGDNVHYVRVLNQFDHLWPEAAEQYGFPVPETEEETVDEDVFVVDALKDRDTGFLTVTDSNGKTETTSFTGSFGSLRPIDEGRRKTRTSSTEKPSPDQPVSTDPNSKGDD